MGCKCCVGTGKSSAQIIKPIRWVSSSVERVAMPASTSFERFIESLCSRKAFGDKAAEEAYRLRVWKQIVEGHRRHVEICESRGIPVEDKVRQELASAIEYGEAHNYT